jgi:hypothetical protein
MKPVSKSGRAMAFAGIAALVLAGAGSACGAEPRDLDGANTLRSAPGPTPSPDGPIPEGAAGSSIGCVEFDADGEYVWAGEPSQTVRDLGTELSEAFGRNRARMAGVAYCSTPGGLAAFVKEGEVELADELVDLASKHKDVAFEVHYVPRSVDEMLALIDKITPQVREDAGLVSYGPDLFTGGLDIGVLEVAGQSAQDLFVKADAVVRPVLGSDVPIHWRTSSGAIHG